MFFFTQEIWANRLDSWLENEPEMKMYFPLKIGDIPACFMLVYQAG